MSKEFIFLACPLLLVLLTACTNSKVSKPETVIQGRIYLTGNEPFVQPALKDTSGVGYLLTGSKEIQENLLKQQGQTVRIYCSQIVKREKLTIATVTRFEIVRSDRESTVHSEKGGEK